MAWGTPDSSASGPQAGGANQMIKPGHLSGLQGFAL
jgi:hypothetical protein